MVQSALAPAETVSAPRARVLAPRAPHPFVRPAPAVRSEVTVHYHRSPPERRLVEMRPWGERSQLMAHCRGPREHESETRLLPLVHDPKRPLALQALRGLSVLFFGPTGLLPRILGEPDWQRASLLLQADAGGSDEELLLRVQLAIEGRNALSVQLHHGRAAAPAAPSSSTMRPGDADPLHALLRIGFGAMPWPGTS